MTVPEDQESQMPFGYDNNAHFNSSPPDSQSTAKSGKSNLDHVSDPIAHGEETQHDSLGSRVEETQFVGLELDTQVYSEPSFQNPGNPLQTATAAMQAMPAASTFSQPAAIERPNLDLENDAPSFKYGKAQQPQLDFRRKKPKITDAKSNINQKADVPEFAATASNTGSISGSSIPYSSSDKAHSNEAVSRREDSRTPIKKKNPQSRASTDANKQTLIIQLPKAQQTPLSSNLDVNQAHARPSEDKLIHTDGTNNAENPIQEPLPLPKPGKEKGKNTAQQQVPNTVQVKAVPMPTDASLKSAAQEAYSHHEQSVPYEILPKAAIKQVQAGYDIFSANELIRIHKCHTMKQPFPEVSELPPGRPMKSIADLNQHRASDASHHFQSMHINGSIPYPESTNRTSDSDQTNIFTDQRNSSRLFQTGTSGSDRQDSLSSCQNNQDKARTVAIRNNSNGGENPGVQVDSILPPPAKSHHNENQKHWAQVPPPGSPRQQITLDNQNQEGEALSAEATHTSHLDTTMHWSRIDNENNQQSGEPSQPNSRPQSALSNTAKVRARPLVTDDLLPQGVSEAAVLSAKRPMKVQRSSGGKNRCEKSHREADIQQDPFATVSGLRSYLQNLPVLEEALKEYEGQKVIIESQQAEIETLMLSNNESKNHIQVLQEEKVVLTKRLKRFTEISAKYKAHMNNVVQAQKHLLDERKNLITESAAVRDQSKAALKFHADRENHEKILRQLILEAKNIRLPAEKREELETENSAAKTRIENLERTNQLLQSDLNTRVLELGRERHNTEQLHKALDAQNEAYRKLVATLKKARTTIVDEFTHGGSVLAAITNSEKSIQTKIDNLSAFINTFNNQEPDLPPTSIKLIENLYTRIENKLQASENQEIAFHESTLKLFEDLKERIKQFRLDERAQAGLKERISELRELNATLTASGSAQEFEVQAMKKRIDEMERELSVSRDQLTAKSNELAALRARPKEDPILVSKMRDLQNDKIVLVGQINTIQQEASKAKEELISCRGSVLSEREHCQELQKKYTEAQTTIKTQLEDKKKYLACYTVEVEKACDEVAKVSHAAKMEVKLQHDCLVKNLEQRRSEAESELALAQQMLQKNQEEKSSYTSNLNQLQEELDICKKEMTQQAAYIKRADERLPTLDLSDRRRDELQQVIAKMTELKGHFEKAQKETSQKIGYAVISHQSETANLIKKVNSLENASSILSQAPRHTGRVPTATTPELFAAQRLSSVASDLSSSQLGTNGNGSFSYDMPATPKDVLRRNELRMYNNRIPNSTPAQSSYTNHDDALRTIQRSQDVSTMMKTYSAVAKLATESSLPYQDTPKPLRPANRKPSGVPQSPQNIDPAKTIKRHSVKVSNLSQTDEQSLAAQPSNDIAMSSSGPSDISPDQASRTIAKPPGGETREDAPYISTAGYEMHSIVPQAPTDETPFQGAPQLASSSPLTDLVTLSIDLVGSEENHSIKVPLETKYSKVTTSTLKKNGGRRASASPHVSAGDTAAAVKFKEISTSYRFSGDDNLDTVNATREVRPNSLSATDESTRRRQSKPLKSALKQSSKTQDTSSVDMSQADVYTIPTSTPTVPNLLKTTTCSNAKQAAPARIAASGSSYNRIARGTKSDGCSQASATLSTLQRPSATKQSLSNEDKSPLMLTTQRSSRKRSASQSELKSQPTKPCKQPRLSLPNQGHTESRTVIPDSQEEHINYRH